MQQFSDDLIRTCFIVAAYPINRGILGKNWKSGVNSRVEWFSLIHFGKNQFCLINLNMDIEGFERAQICQIPKEAVWKKMRMVFSKHTLFHWIPLLKWLPSYDLQCLSGDLIAGLTCALTIIPQGIGNAPIAGIPVQVK